MRNIAQLLSAVILTVTACSASADDVPNPSFSLIGHIEQLSLDNAADNASGGVMKVSNIPVVLPAGLLVTMPGQYLTPHDLFVVQGASVASSGLALQDVPRPVVPFEAEIIGNIVNDKYIAADVRLSQGALHQGAGFIQSIDLATGEMRVGAHAAASGARVRLNDPKGIYGLANGEGAKAAIVLDDRFALDPDNSPVHAKTGFPVCVPRSAADAKCPASNRPADAAHFRYTCAVSGTAAAGDAPIRSCDPTLPVPLMVGDYITYAGVLQDAGSGAFLVAAFGLEAELGIYTAAGSEPVYVFIEEGIQGTKGEAFTAVDQEETTRFRFVGFTTDPTRPVEIHLLDSDRNKSGPSFTGPVGLSAEDTPLGRVRNTWPAKDDARAVRRDVVASVVGSSHLKLATTGLTSGQYVSPVSEYIYPEVTVFGVPGYPVPIPTENFCFLASGGGSVDGPGGTTNLGRLSPFPESGHALSQPVGTSGVRACDGQ